MIERIEHKTLNSILRRRICEIKSARWNYSLEECSDWMKENLNANDLHLILSKDEEDIAYLNIVTVVLMMNDRFVSVKGLGNVCTKTSGKGYGNDLMNEVNQFFLTNNFKAILLCKDHLISYYEKFGWKLVNQDNILTESLKSINVMTYNIDEEIESLEYTGRNF